MANQYPIPQDIHEKEKIIGGMFTISQFIFIALGAVSALFGGIGIYTATNNLMATGATMVICAAIFVPFGFIKVRKYGDVELFQLVLMKIKYAREPKEYLNISENYREEIVNE